MGFLTALIKGIFTLFGFFILFIIVAILLTWLVIFLLIRKVRKRVEELKRQSGEDTRKREFIDEIVIDVEEKK